jgi:hypothetical protein
MVDVIVPFPEDLHNRVESAASARGLTLDEFVRQCVVVTIDKGNRAADPFLSDKSVYHGDVPSDLSERHDDYLYGEEQ